MRGLFLNGFYSAAGYIRVYLFFIAAAAAAVLFMGNDTAIELFVYITVPLIAMNAVAVSGRDIACRWSKFEITLPVRRSDIIKSRYMIYLFWSMVGAVFAFAVSVASMFRQGTLFVDVSGLCSMFALGIGISILAGAFFHPLCCLAGADKNEIVLLISILLAVGTAIVSLNILNRFLSSFAVRMGIFIAFYCLVFAVSYLLSLCIYLKKEF